MLGLLGFAATIAAVVIGYTQSRAFVRERLRYVDAAQSGIAPLLAGFGAAIIASPIVALLPLVGGGTALAFGISVGMGVANGQRDVRRALPPGL
ncbi:MAG TPA: hypothetical protein PKC83_05385 [Gemmatimonadaceae bacterium]|nr:MAG: hypothetical protein ABS52_09730 [Gemmatimonadetes bacterium SCN 70-22]HMN08201.1 hypothetical protein [Gemmatimonadaceae bacterium]